MSPLDKFPDARGWPAKGVWHDHEGGEDLWDKLDRLEATEERMRLDELAERACREHMERKYGAAAYEMLSKAPTSNEEKRENVLQWLMENLGREPRSIGMLGNFCPEGSPTIIKRVLEDHEGIHFDWVRSQDRGRPCKRWYLMSETEKLDRAND